MRETPQNSVLIEAILKEHSEEDFRNALKQLKEKCGDQFRKRIDFLLNIEDLSRVTKSLYIRLPLIDVCKMLKVKIPYVYIQYPDRRTPEQVKRDKKDKEARDRARPPKIDYEEEISKIREKYQMKIQEWCKGDRTCFETYKVEEFHEIIDLYLARLREPHKPTDEDGGLPPYVVWSLAELRRAMTYIRKLPDEIVCDYDKLIGGFFRRHLNDEILDYRAIAGNILSFQQDKMGNYESYAY